MSNQGLDQKVVIITGAGRGIGYGIARRLSDEGAVVVIADINEKLARESAGRISGETGNIVDAVQCDVSDRSSVDSLLSSVIERFRKVDIMVANAGICPFVDFLQIDNETWQKTIDVNLTGAFNCGQAAALTMIRNGISGRIIFITSLSTISAAFNQVDYAASKSGVKMLMASMATGLGKHNITVNAVAPGVIYTEMGAFHWDVPEHRAEFAESNPIGRLGEPADVAAAVAFLASEDSKYITGSSIRVDGGKLAIG